MQAIQKTFVLLLLLLANVHCTVHAQFYTKQNKIWKFGRNTGISFATGVPVPVSSAIYTDEGCAAVGDTSGNMLFYTQGDSIWNRNDVVMPNGAGLVPFSCNSTSQAAVIVPVIGTTTKYYVFSLEHILASGCLAYSIVDMSLDGGLGDVPVATRGLPIDSGFTEKMVAVRGNCCIWLLVHKADSAKFYAYKITASGINFTPVISSVGVYPNYHGYGVIKISPNRTKLALTHFELTADTSRTELYDFNANTGIVSNCRILNTYSNPYGAEFSPNSSKLYVHHWTYGKLLQYDITGTTAGAIKATEYVVASSLTIGSDMRLGPDSNIYFSSNHSYLDRINDPNNSGSACNYTSNTIDLGAGTCILGLPPVYWSDTACPTGAPLIADAVQQLLVYPNPANSIINIIVPGKGNCNIQLLDMTGRVWVTTTGAAENHTTLSTDGIPDGQYVVRADAADGTIFRTTIVVHKNR
jgi:hypothetical protein